MESKLESSARCSVTLMLLAKGLFVFELTVGRIVADCSISPSIANKRRICYLPVMRVRSCRVTIQDMDGISHTVEVWAAMARR